MAYGVGRYGVGGYGIMTQTVSTTITLEEQGEIAVSVERPDGTPLSGADVTLTGASGSVDESGTTDDAGQVVFGGVPIADYTVTASKTGYFADEVTVAAGDFS